MSVPCGTSSTIDLHPTIICFCVSGLRPIWLTTALRTALRAHELPDANPWPGRVVGNDGEILLSLTHQLIDDRLWTSDTHESADHQASTRREPSRRLALSGIVFIFVSKLFASTHLAIAQPIRRRRAARRPGFPRPSPSTGTPPAHRAVRGSQIPARRLLVSEQFDPCLLDRNVLLLGAIVDLLLHERCQYPTRTNGVACESGSSLSQARRPW